MATLYNKVLLLPLLVLTLCLAACSETSESSTDEEVADVANWQARNDTYFAGVYAKAQDSITAGNPNWYIFKSYTKAETSAITDHIVVRVISQIEGAEHGETDLGLLSPLSTDTAYVHYRGRLMPSDKYPEGKRFDTSWYGDYNLERMSPYSCVPTAVVDGFATAIQRMHIGDRWEVYIPYALGYGATAQGTTGASGWIPAYSTLIFDLTLQRYKRPAQTQ